MDSSSYSDDGQIDERYIKKVVPPECHQEDDIVGDPVSQESKQALQFKELDSNQDMSDMKQYQCEGNIDKIVNLQKQVDKQEKLSFLCQIRQYQNIQNQEVYKKQQEDKKCQQKIYKEQKKQDDNLIKSIPSEQIQQKINKNRSLPIRFIDYHQEIQNKIQKDENYLQYIRNKKLEYQDIKLVQVQEERKPNQKQTYSFAVCHEAIKSHQFNYFEKQQISQSIIHEQGIQNFNQPKQKKQFPQISPINIQNQNSFKKLKQGEQSSFSSQKINYFKEFILNQIKQQYRKMLYQQRLIREQLIKNAAKQLKEVIEQKMNENREQNSKQNMYLKNMILKVNDSLIKLEERLQKLQKKKD